MMGLLLALCLSAPPQQAPPPRDTARPAATREGAISGRVLDPDGKTPLRRAIVRVSAGSLPRRLTVRADLLGRYALSGLPAGRYTVSASKAGRLALEYGQRRPFEPGRRIDLAAGERLGGVDIVLPPAGSISGNIVDDAGEPVSQMWVSAARQAYRNGRRAPRVVATTVTNDIGEYRLSGLAPGDYYIVTRERGARVTDFSDEPTGYGTTIYPGVSTMAAAQPIGIAVGQQVPDVSLPIVASRTAVITGTVVDESGAPMAAQRISMTDAPDVAGLGGVLGNSVTDAAGNFRIAGVRPGIYSLFADNRGKTGDVQVEVREQNVTGLTIVLGSGGTLAGRVVTPAGPPGAKAALVQLCTLAAGSSRCSSGSPRVGQDGAFAFTGVRGSRLVRAYGMPDGWWLKAVLQGDRDVTDTPFSITHGDAVRDLQIVFDDKPTVLTGTVTTTAAGADYTALVFAADERLWTPESRFIAAERPDHRGRFRVTALPPGDYLVAAVEWVEDGQWLDPQYLQALRPLASKVTLTAGEAAAVVLEILRAAKGQP